jgi:quercetin dioxygenase-like cupin family protein
MRPILVALSLTLSASVAVAQGAPTVTKPHAVVVLPDQVTWAQGPASLPAGAKAAVLEGDPKQEGPFTMRISLPDGYRIPPHSHPAVERVTVIQGTFRIGMGDKFEGSALTSLPAGAFVAMQPGTNHFVQTKGNTIVQVNAIGPWKINYVNKADDPRKGTPQ